MADNPYPDRRTCKKPTVQVHHSANNPHESCSRVVKVDMLHDFPKVGISVDVHAFCIVNSTLVVDLVSRKGGSPKEFAAGETTIDPPVAFYIESPLRQHYRLSSDRDAPPTGVISTVDTSKAIMHARTRASVSGGSTLVNVSKVLQQNETADDDFYAVVHYHGRLAKLTIATSCMPIEEPPRYPYYD